MSFSESWRWGELRTASGENLRGITRMVEDEKGAIWIAGKDGLQRFDGFGLTPARGILEGTVDRVALIAGGTVAALAEGRVYIGDAKGFVRANLPTGVRARGIASVQFPDGSRSLVADTGAGLWRWRGSEWTAWTGQGARTGPLWPGRAGYPWMVMNDGLKRWNGRDWEMGIEPPAGTAGGIIVTALESSAAGGVVSLAGPAALRGLWAWKGVSGKPERVEHNEGDPARAASVSTRGNVVVVFQSGLVKARQAGVWTTGGDSGGRLEGANAMVTDQAGNLWVGTRGGLHRFESSASLWEHWSESNADARNTVNAIMRATDGTWWTGSPDGLTKNRQGKREWIREIQGQRLGIVTGIAEDDEGGLWVVSGASFGGAYRFHRGAWRHYGEAEGLSGFPNHGARRDRRGRLWIANASARVAGRREQGGAYLWKDGRFERWGQNKGLPDDMVYSVLESRDGALWFATGAGLARWQAGKVRV